MHNNSCRSGRWPSETKFLVPIPFSSPLLLYRRVSLPLTLRHLPSAYFHHPDHTVLSVVQGDVQPPGMIRYVNVFRPVEMRHSAGTPQQSVGMPKDRSVHNAPAKLFARRQEPVCHLLRLPPEVRIIIYQYALIAVGTPRMRAHGITKPLLCTLAQPQLAFVNRKLREECLPVFYANNNFHIAVRQGPACWPWISEEEFSRVLESFYLYWNGFPRESNLRSIQSIQLSWGPSTFITSINYRLADFIVSFGLPIPSIHSTRLQVAPWSKRGVEEAVYAAVRQSLRSWPAARRYNLMLDASSLRPIMNIIWLCGNNCPVARRYVELCTLVEDLSRR